MSPEKTGKPYRVLDRTLQFSSNRLEALTVWHLAFPLWGHALALAEALGSLRKPQKQTLRVLSPFKLSEAYSKIQGIYN